MNQSYPTSRRTALRVIATTMVGATVGVQGVTASEHEQFPEWPRVTWGEPVPMGEGTVSTYLRHSPAGDVNLVGLYFTAGAWEGLPSPEEEPHAHFALDLPDGGEETPFAWVGIDWAAEGHPPMEIYGDPHLDIHFYMMERDAVHEIPPDDDYRVPLAADQHPPDYIRTHEVVPMMGEHLVDPTAPEFQGEPFTHTFIWGAYGGDLTFYEPMVTIDYLEALREETRTDIEMPEAFAQADGYPTRYAIEYHPDLDAYTVSLECFRPFDGSRC